MAACVVRCKGMQDGALHVMKMYSPEGFLGGMAVRQRGWSRPSGGWRMAMS